MMPIPGGTFLLGSPDDEDDRQDDEEDRRVENERAVDLGADEVLRAAVREGDLRRVGHRGDRAGDRVIV